MKDVSMLALQFSICRIITLCFSLCILAPALHAQEKGTLEPQPLPPLIHPDDPSLPAKELFGRAEAPASLTACHATATGRTPI